MKKPLILFLTALFCLSAASIKAEDSEQAAALYAAGNYGEAATLYQQILDNAPLSRHSRATVLYNLGNARFKQGELSQAILAYERSLRLNPRDKDVQYNLEFARTQIIDNIEDNRAFFFSSWAQAVRDTLTEETWQIVSLATFVLMLTGILLFLLGRTIALRKASFHIAWILLLVCIVSGLNAGSLHRRDSQQREAIITQGVLNAKSSPDRSGTDLFTLHEGTKVEIIETLGEWCNIRVGNNEGWILQAHAERI